MRFRVVTETASPSQPAALVRKRLYVWFSKERLLISSLSSETN